MNAKLFFVLSLIAALIFAGKSDAQSVPNGGAITAGQGWTVPQWNTAWKSKVDTTNGILTNPTLNGPIINTPTLNNSILNNPTLNSPAVNNAVLAGNTTGDISNASVTPSGGSSTPLSTWMGYLFGTSNPNSVVQGGGVSIPKVSVLSGSQGGDAAHSALFSQAGWSGSTTLGKLPLSQFSASMNVSAPHSNAVTLLSNQSVGGSSAAAQYTAFQGQITQTAGTGAKAAGAPGAVFVPFQAFATVGHSEGGTGTGPGQAYGTLVGYDANMELSSGATNFYALQGLQLGVPVDTGASVSHRAGIQIYSSGIGQGALTDAGIDIAGTVSGDPGFQCGLCFGMTDTTVWPVAASGTMIGTYNLSSGTQAATYGLDFSAITFSSGFLKSTGFLVDGSGNETAASLGITGAAANSTMLSATGGSHTGTDATPDWNFATTLNTSGAPDAFKIAVTTTAIGSSGRLFNVYGGASGTTSEFSVDQFGDIAAAGNLAAGTANQISWNSRGILTSPASATIQFGGANSASPSAQTVQAQGVSTGTSNTAGVSWTFAGSKGTGTGAGGSIIFQTAPAGSTGTSQNAEVTALTIDSSGNLTAPKLATAGTIAGSICATSAGLILYESGASSCTISRRALKKDIALLSESRAFQDIMNLKPVNFNWKTGDVRRQTGFIAEDVHAVNPSLSTYDGKGKLQGYEPNAILAELVAVVQRQQAEIDQLKKTVR